MIIFDTETTCLDAKEGQIAQLSYIKVNKGNEIEFAKNFYFTVDYIDPGASAVNGLTVESLIELSNNKRFSDFADEIYTDFNSDDLLIAHNVGFDKSFLLEEFRRLDKDTSSFENSNKYFCTMEYYTDVLKIEHSYYGWKFPKLSEVANYLGLDYNSLEEETSKAFNIDAEDISYHDARFDVITTYNIYKCIGKDFERYNSMCKIVSKMDDMERVLRYMRGILKDNDIEELSITDIDAIDNIFKLVEEDNWHNIQDLTEEMISDSNIILNCISKEIEKNKRAKDMEISEVIEQALNNEDATVRKAVLLEETNFGRIERYLVFDVQINEIVADCPNYNVDLIQIDNEKYLMMNYDEEYAYIITIKNDREYSKGFYDIEEYFDAYYVIDMEKCPSITQLPVRLYSVKDYKTMIKIPLSHYNNFSSTVVKDTNYNQLIDDDLPF